MLKLISKVTPIYFILIFSSPVRKYRKSSCTTVGVGIGGGGVNKNVKVLLYVKGFIDLIFSKSSVGFSLYLV